MNYKKFTAILTFAIIPALIAIVLIYDAYAISQSGTEASISSLLIVMSYKQPLIPLCIGLFSGILLGHLFWRMKGNKETTALGIDTEYKKGKLL